MVSGGHKAGDASSKPARDKDAAAADTSPAPGAQRPYLLAGYLLAAGGVGFSLLLYPGDIGSKVSVSPVLPATGATMFAGLYIAAQAVERLIEPLSNAAGGIFGGLGKHPDNRNPSTKITKRQVTNTLANADPADVASAAADNAQFRSNSTVLMFGVATLLAGILTGVLGLTLLHQVGVDNAAVGWDLVVTTLAVGAGTKPLHDLIGNISAAKEAKQDSKRSGG